MSAQSSPDNAHSTCDEYWHDFRLFPSRLDEFVFKHWYLFTIGLYLLQLILALIIDLLSHWQPSCTVTDPFGTRTRMWTMCILTDWTQMATIAVFALGALAFNHWRRHIPETFQALFDERHPRFVSKSGAQNQESECLDSLNKFQQLLFSNKRYILASTLAVLVFLSAMMSGLPSSSLRALAEDGIAGSLRTLLLLIVWLFAPVIWAYSGGIGAWSICVTSKYIRNLVPRFDLNIQRSHPDRCGGLKSLGDLCFSMALPILLGAIFLGVYSGAYVSVYASLIAKGVTNKSVQSQMIFALVLFLVALPLAYIAFFAPLWDIHREMVDKRKEYENEFADRLARVVKRIQVHLDKGELEEAKKAKEEMQIVQELHPTKINYPVWPFNHRILLRFLTPQIIPPISLIVGLSEPVAKALSSILTIFAGE